MRLLYVGRVSLNGSPLSLFGKTKSTLSHSLGIPVRSNGTLVCSTETLQHSLGVLVLMHEILNRLFGMLVRSTEIQKHSLGILIHLNRIRARINRILVRTHEALKRLPEILVLSAEAPEPQRGILVL